MILVALLIIPALGGVVAVAVSGRSRLAPRVVALAALGVELALALAAWGTIGRAPTRDFRAPWIPALGVSFHLSMDGISLLLVLLTAVLGIIAVLASWRGIQERVGLFHLNLLVILSAIVGVFLAADLFLFYFFWELMLIPMYFLIDLWGHERRHYAAVKFFLFTLISGLLMLVAILGLYFAHGRVTGEYTFDYAALLGTPLPPATALWLMLGFFTAFAVKLPAVPLHTWLADAHTEAPTAGSVVLAGLLLKTGAYGMIRFVVPLFPTAALQFAPVAMGLGVAGILYGAFLAFAQHDFKRLVAYTSISHLGFVLLGIFAWNQLALQGAMMQMLCHGLSTGGLFIVAGALQDRLGTRDMRRMGGLWSAAPKMGALTLVLALAALGLPGLGNFVGEILVLLGAYQVYPVLAIVATAGLVLATVYALWMMHVVFFGKAREAGRPAELDRREIAVLGVMIALLVALGLGPQRVLDTAGPALARVERGTEGRLPLIYTGVGPTPPAQTPAALLLTQRGLKGRAERGQAAAEVAVAHEGGGGP
jgi:NADH-quinone oxidoreductase subunit M